MQYSSTGSLFEKNMVKLIPLRYFDLIFYLDYEYLYRGRFLANRCQGDVKRNVGKWGRLKTFIEHGNMYRLHVPRPSSNWTIQQTLDVKYKDKFGKW